MPIGNIVIYNAGDLILSTVSSSGNTFQENKIAAATSSVVLFDNNGRINSQSLNSLTVGTASVLTSANSYIITNLTASNISASGNVSSSTLWVNNGTINNFTSSDFLISNIKSVSLTRSLQTTLNNTIDIGTFASTNGASGLDVFIAVPSVGYSMSKRYIIPMQWNLVTGTWNMVAPIAATGPYGTNDFVLDASASNGSIGLRLRNTAGSTAGTAYITMLYQGNASADAFTPSTATGSVAAPTSYWPSAFMTQVARSNGGAGAVPAGIGIGTLSPKALLDVSGSVNCLILTASAVSSSGFISASNGFISGSLYVNGQIIASSFSASTIYLTSSQLIIGDNIITLNAALPIQRYAGIQMYDSSSGNLSNLFWDSLNNYMFISSSDASASRQIILGPVNEAGLTTNYIPLISGSNNISNSIIYQNNNNIGIGLTTAVNKLDVAGNISCSVITASLFSGSLSGSVFGTSSWANNALTSSYLVAGNSYIITNLTASNILLNSAPSLISGANLNISASNFIGTFVGTSSWATSASYAATASNILGGTINRIPLWSGSAILTSSNLYQLNQNIGIGTITPFSTLDVNGFTKLAKGTSIYPTTVASGTQITGSSNVEIYYPNIIAYSANSFVSGSTIIHTPISRTANEMFKIDVKGYIYGLYKIVDFSVVGYAFSSGTGSNDGLSGNIISYGISDRGTDNFVKAVGVDSNNNVAIAFGATSSVNYFQKLTVDYYSYNVAVNATGSWYIDNVTGSATGTGSYGWGDERILTPVLSQNSTVAGTNGVAIGIGYTNKYPVSSPPTNGLIVQGNVGIGTASPTKTLEVIGTISASAFSGSHFGTSSWAQSSSNTINSQTASYLTIANNYTIANLTASGGISFTGAPSIITGANLTINASSFTGSLIGTSSWASNVLTASYLTTNNSYQIGDLTSSRGILYKNAVLLDFSSSTMPTTSSVVLQNLTGSFNAAFFDYVVYSSSNARAGTITSVWLNNNLKYSELYTTDIGNTTSINIIPSLSGSSIQLIATGSVINWTIKSSVRYL